MNGNNKKRMVMINYLNCNDKLCMKNLITSDMQLLKEEISWNILICLSAKVLNEIFWNFDIEMRINIFIIKYNLN